MTEFDFDTPFSRDGTSSQKHETFRHANAIPMWVADTDFQSPPEVREALKKRADHGSFGYTLIPHSLNDITLAWLKKRYNWEVEASSLVWLPGVVPGFNLAIRTLTELNEGVAVQTPNYPPLLNAAFIAHRKPLQVSTIIHNGGWTLDMESVEKTFANPECRMFILCNPMNPCGQTLEPDQLIAITELAKRHRVSLVSDEIHCDLRLDDNVHTPLGKLEPNAITLMAASKTFNIAGLACSFAVIPNPEIRKKFLATGNGLVAEPNLLGLVATEAAFKHGEDWLAAQITYLKANLKYLMDRISAIPGLSMLEPDATFLAWIDCHETGLKDPFKHFLRHGVALSDGKAFGQPGFIRLNFGCSRNQLKEALDRMEKALDNAT